MEILVRFIMQGIQVIPKFPEGARSLQLLGLPTSIKVLQARQTEEYNLHWTNSRISRSTHRGLQTLANSTEDGAVEVGGGITEIRN